MKIGDQIGSGIYAGDHDGHHIFCSPIEYELPFRINWHHANEYCKSIGMELPTKEELKLLYELYKSNLNYFPNRKYFWYWSSTESSSTSAWLQSFYNGNQAKDNKTNSHYVRAIKRIKI